MSSTLFIKLDLNIDNTTFSSLALSRNEMSKEKLKKENRTYAFNDRS